MGKQYKKEKSGGNSLRDNNSKPSESIYGEYFAASGDLNPYDHLYDTSEDIRENYGSPNIYSDIYVAGVDEPVVSQNLPEIQAIPEQNGKYSKVKPMQRGMEEFDKDLQKAGVAHSKMASTTFYADTPEKKKPFEREFKDGKLDGLDTIGAEKPAAIGAKGDRHIFTMDNQGKFTTGDAIGENTKNFNESLLAGKNTQERFHHSSLSSGKAVAGAGELQVRDGQVEIFSDTSGHYRPGSEQMHNVAKELEDQNAGVEKITAEFIGKSRDQKQISASALEVLGWGSGKDNPEQSKIEENIRGSHAKKDKVMEELLTKRKTIG